MTKNTGLRNTTKYPPMYSFHYTVTIFSTLSNLSVNWTTSTKSLCVFAHRWQFIICYEQFPCYYSLEPQRKRSIFISTSHPHVLVHTHPRWPLHTNENENRNSGKKVEPIWWGNENANLENVWNSWCCVIPFWVVVLTRRDSISF